MNRYYYKAVDLSGKSIKGICEAESLTQLYSNLRKKGLYISDFKIKNKFKILNKKRVNDRELSILFKQLYLIIKSGINIETGLQILYTQTNDKNLKYILLKIKNDINKGKSVQSSFKKFSNIFSEFSINMLSAGEHSGNLELITLKLSEHYEFQYNLKKKIISALNYPILLLITSFIVLNILIIGVIPTFSNILISLNVELPVITKIILAISNFMCDFKYCIFIFIIVLLGICKYLRNKKNSILQDIKLSIPFLKKIYIKVNCINILKSIGILSNSGIPILATIDITMDSVKSKKIKNKILEVYRCINNGRSFSEACDNSNLFEPNIISMLSLGEKSGNLDKMLIESSNVLTSDLKCFVKKISDILSPILIIALAILVGTIIISVVIPMLDIMNNI